MRVDRILVGLDGSEHSSRALLWAATLARDLHADVVAVHAMSLGLYPPMAIPLPSTDDVQRKELLETMEIEWCAELRRQEIPFRVLVEEGSAAEALMRVAEREKADLIVVGSRGLGGFKELLLGSVGHQLSTHAKQPVVIIPPECC